MLAAERETAIALTAAQHERDAQSLVERQAELQKVQEDAANNVVEASARGLMDSKMWGLMPGGLGDLGGLLPGA